MLKEIRCDRFIENGRTRPPIKFHNGLNAIIGNESGTNSVGKSTFLMILDFVFGGEDYIKKNSEVNKLENVGPHVIQFELEFDNQSFFFSRSTEGDKHNTVVPCDENYNPLPGDPWKINEYCDFLAEKYGLREEGQTWRGCVTRFIRVDRRDTLDTEKPLKSYKSESDRDGIISLIKLFGEYHAISEKHKAKDAAVEEEKAYKDALAHEFIPSVKNVTEYKQNADRIVTLEALLNELANQSSQGLLELTSLQAEQITSIKNRIAALRRQRSMMRSQKNAIEQSKKEKHLWQFQSDFRELLRFFPNADVTKLVEVEDFHRQLSSILNSEVRDSVKHLDAMITLATDEISKLEQDQLMISQIPNVTKATLVRYAELQKEILELQSANDAYDRKGELKKRTEAIAEDLNNLIEKKMRYIETKVNSLMDEMNEKLYDVKIKPPLLHAVSSDQYEFSTEDDHGTGMRCKGVVLLDLALLRSTKLPFIIHDSVLLLNIENEAIEKILELYNEQKDKQVFIAFDKTATPRAMKLLETVKVQHFSRNGNELFGKSWNRRQEEKMDLDNDV